MIPISLDQFAEIVRGEIIPDSGVSAKNIEVGTVSTDTRSLSPGDLFIALRACTVHVCSGSCFIKHCIVSIVCQVHINYLFHSYH